MSKFFKGAMILLVAGLITRVLGFVNRIVVARFIGEEGVGLYMMALPTLFLVITITQFGLPVAISKFVAEANAVGDQKRIKKILVVSLSITVGLSLIFTPALFLLAPILSETLFTDERTYWPLMAIAPIVPIIAVSSVLRGYFQGKQNMKPAAYSQVLEQVVRITLIAVMTKSFLPYGIEYAAAGAMLSSVIGELVSLAYLMTTFKVKKHFKVRSNFFKSVRKGRDTFNELMSIALPSMGSRMIGSIAWFLEPIVVAQSLAIAGISAGVATKQYGELTGYALPLLMLPSFVTMALSTSLVPAVSEAHASGNYKAIQYRLQQALRITFITGCLSVIALYVFAVPLMEAMYGTSGSAVFIKFMAPFFIFYYYQMPLQSVLQALNLAKAAMINSLIGAVAKTAIIFLLASREEFGIMGAALGMAVGIVLVTFLHFFTIVKKVSFTIEVRQYLVTLGVTFLSGFIGFLCYNKIFTAMGPITNLLVSITILTIVFIILLIGMKVIKKSELQKIPYISFLIR
ncbi:stage V sporulation protein B [Peribacillus alkalitolerans]|uniref:stage V sporulation protein B n=1 Tax=Peribacillus alkalitolerans TaxID=1550385 RepID=UPI0013D4AC5C|nr:stage V sporulation protein B [Peribacillus alkalitolerans]